MRMKTRISMIPDHLWRFLKTGVLIAGALLVLATPTLARDGAAAGNAAQAEEKAEDNTATLDTIVVTGEKTERTTHESSASVKIYDAHRIESAANATRVSDLLKLTPNIVDVGNGNDLPTVRGTDGSGPGRGAVAFLTGTRPRLNLSLDGRSLSYNELAFGPMSLWDVDRVEIFLGPQSYLQGRNAIAGSVLLRSRDPEFDWGGAVKTGMAENAYFQTAAMVTGPLVRDELALRVSIDRQARDSFQSLKPYAPVGDPGELESVTARAKLLYTPAGLPGLLSRFSVNHFDTRVPQSEVVQPEAGTGSKFSGSRPVWETESTSAIWDLELGFMETLVFKNKMIYTDFANDRLTVPSDAYANIDGNEFQVEPVLHFGENRDRAHGLVGGRYFYADQDEFVNIFNGSTFTDETKTASLFGEITYGVLPRVDVTLGGRFEHEHRVRKGSGVGMGAFNVEMDFDETYSVFLPKVDLAWKLMENHTVGAKTSKGYRAGGAGITFDTPWTSYAYKEEYVWNYEVYTRHRLAGGRIELTSNFFYNDYEDMQLPYYINASAVTIINAESAETYGADFGLRWLPLSSLEIFGGVGLLQTKIKSFSQASYEGNELPRAPSFSTHAGAVYRFGQGFELSGSMTYSDGYYSYYDNLEAEEISSYWVANLQLAYDFSWGRAAVYARNAFDKDNTILITDHDLDAPVTLDPRMMGVSLEIRF